MLVMLPFGSLKQKKNVWKGTAVLGAAILFNSLRAVQRTAMLLDHTTFVEALCHSNRQPGPPLSRNNPKPSLLSFMHLTKWLPASQDMKSTWRMLCSRVIWAGLWIAKPGHVCECMLLCHLSRSDSMLMRKWQWRESWEVACSYLMLQLLINSNILKWLHHYYSW